MAKAAKKHTPTKSKADSSKFGLSIVKDVFPRWHVRLGSSEDAKNELEAFLRSVPSLRLQVSSNGKKRRSVVESPEFWKDEAYLFVQTGVDGVDRLRFHCTDYVDVSDWRTGSDWRTADFLVRLDDVEHWERLCFPMTAVQPPAPGKEPAPTKTLKPDTGTKPSRKPSFIQAARDAAIQHRLINRVRPGSTVQWDRFCHAVRCDCGVYTDDPKKIPRGLTDDRIARVTRLMMERQA